MIKKEMTVSESAALLLVVHMRRDIRGCVCGWSEPGRSHAVHQAAMLREAGLLKESPE